MKKAVSFEQIIYKYFDVFTLKKLFLF